MSKYTHTPWKYEETEGPGFYVLTENRDVVAYCQRGHVDRLSESEANAAHIVKCVNLFDEIIAFLESINGRCKDNAMDVYLTDLLSRARGANE